MTQADEAGVTVARVCGEMGGRRLEALALLGLGIRRFSITPAAVGPIKAMIRSAPQEPGELWSDGRDPVKPGRDGG